VRNALKQYLGVEFVLTTYTEHAMEIRSTASAVSYVGVERGGKTYWGVGVHSDIATSSIKALLGALNRMLVAEQ
jgi:2-isopropylmalate synthase